MKELHCAVFIVSRKKGIPIGNKKEYFQDGYLFHIGEKEAIDKLAKSTTIIFRRPYKTRSNVKCTINKRIEKFADKHIEGFEPKDCDCKSHLHFSRENPLEEPEFHDNIYLREED
ncbi:MAG: hypothetical protein ABIJ92_02910 [Candidatus Aenigmatarchaeota archaeon]